MIYSIFTKGHFLVNVYLVRANSSAEAHAKLRASNLAHGEFHLKTRELPAVTLDADVVYVGLFNEKELSDVGSEK